MNFEQAKAMRIASWRSTLDNHDLRIENPEAYRSILHHESARLAEEGLIDWLDQFDMDEMANAGYWLAIEEAHIHPVMYHSSFGYDVVPRGGGPRFGTIFHSMLRIDENEGNRMGPYDGKIYRTKEGLVLNQSYESLRGTVEGLVLTLSDGRQFDLIERMGMVLGVVYEAIDDPEIYRWLVDVTQIAMENKDLDAMSKLRPFLQLAKFIQCAACQDHFGRRDECPTCDGQGFTPKPAPHSYTPGQEE